MVPCWGRCTAGGTIWGLIGPVAFSASRLFATPGRLPIQVGGLEGGSFDWPGVIILTVSGGYQSQKFGLFPFNPPLRDGKIRRPVGQVLGISSWHSGFALRILLHVPWEGVARVRRNL